MPTSVTTHHYVIDVDEQTFATDVLERSKTVPVVVDFWAAWCGPCRMLGPILEKLANEYKGQFVLAKVDVDQNQQLARQYYVQGIPAVKAFKDGRVANEFTGALPEPQVRQWLNSLVPSEVELMVKEAFQLETQGRQSAAEERYRAALARQTDLYAAKVGLGRVLFQQGAFEQGLEVLESIPAAAPERRVADALIAAAQFQQHAAGQSEADLKAKLEANPGDVASRYALASLYATQQQFVQALDEFLEVVRRNRQYEDDGARKAMLALFTVIGENTDTVRTYRQKLANVLF
ncbi:MAG TPA: thioredoxin [Anaerolineae bacterium]|nr:thioredoxin [Anaerolineae bacterium]HMR64564.1 thioredoxin [Anaerolineae bacterium]